MVPVWTTSDKQETMARTIRPKIHARPDFLGQIPELTPNAAGTKIPAATDWAGAQASLDLDKSVPGERGNVDIGGGGREVAGWSGDHCQLSESASCSWFLVLSLSLRSLSAWRILLVRPALFWLKLSTQVPGTLSWVDNALLLSLVSAISRVTPKAQSSPEGNVWQRKGRD